MSKAELITITEIVMLAGVLLWVGWDIFAATRNQTGVTISAVTWSVIKNNPWVPFLVGFLCGHLFWQAGPAGN